MRFYRALLLLYPEAFRTEYREELCRAFAERMHGRSAAFKLIAAIADVVPNAIGAHWDVLRHGAASGAAVPAFTGDVRFALRQIGRTPLFSAVVIAVIALGIGINAGLLTTLDTVAWRPAPGIEPDPALVRLLPRAARGRDNRIVQVRLSYPELTELRAQHTVFTDVAGWAPRNIIADLGGGVEMLRVTLVTQDFFRLPRVKLAAGAGFPPGVETSAAPIAVIDYALWTTNFGASPAAIGKTIRIMNQPFTIVGVAPPLFTGIDVKSLGQPTIWVPLGARAILEPNATDTVRLEAFARLAGGRRTADVHRLTTPLDGQVSIDAERLTGMLSGASDTHELVIAFFLVAAFVTIITCTNVSALLLGRAVARRREVGVRLALGATRRRLIRQMLTESLVYATAGAALGLVLYTAAIKIAYAMIPELVIGLEPRLVTFFYAAIFALATTIVFGLAPALHATSADIGEVMKNSGTSSIKRSRLQAAFVVAQLACSQPVLVVTSLVLADMRRGMNDAADQAPASVVTMSADLVRPDSGGSAYRSIARRLQQMPGVTAVAMSYGVDGESFETATGSALPSDAPRIHQTRVTADYFSILGIPIVRGRPLGAGDIARGSTAVVVSEYAAQLLWPGEDPIGKKLVRRSQSDSAAVTSLQVIGVAGSAAYDDRPPAADVFAPMFTEPPASPHRPGAALIQSYAGPPTIAVRTSGDARTFVPAIRAAIRDVEPFIAITDVSTIAERYAASKREAVQSNAAAFAVGAAALVLASLGLYAIIAFAVAQRTREIGIRLAMGSTPRGVVQYFLRHGLRVSGVALAIGLPATVAGIRLIKASVIGFTVHDVATVVIVVPVLLGVALLASWLPARRAGSVDPLIALRGE